MASATLDKWHAQREMPRYQCYKQVWALKIAKIVHTADGGADITPEDSGYSSFHVDLEYLRKHMPQEGGYYVVYDDGYKSFSPAEAFESGYFPRTSAFVQEQKGQYGPKRVFFMLQDGPIKEHGVNGAQIDAVLEFVRNTIARFHDAVPCRENAIVLTKIDEALLWLWKRKSDREKRNVEGTQLA